MKSITGIIILTIVMFIGGCTNGQTGASKTDLNAEEFAASVKANPTAVILDVRTPEEFAEGHLEMAKNVNWNGNTFDEEISTLEKSKPVMVYCRSGKRSAAAADKMRSIGFTTVYELKGGIQSWENSNFPVIKE